MYAGNAGIHPHPRPPHSPPFHSNHLSPSVLSKKTPTPLAQITKRLDRKVCVNSSNIPAIFSKASQAFCRKPFMRLLNVPPTALWRLWRRTCACLLKWCHSSRDPIALPLLSRSPLRILMICERVNLILVFLFKPWGSNYHLPANLSKASVTLSSASGKLSA